jgi:peptidoglycan/LPS O-acetylase OafA/YrhL
VEQTNFYRRIDAIDALRGIAASSVVLQHVYGIRHLPVDDWIRWLVGQGLGVPLFFAVSAFCLYCANERHRGDDGSALAFYIRRFFRIAPLYYFMLVIFILFLKAAKRPDFLPMLGLSVSFTYNFFVTAQQPGIVWASWTISIEMAFYALFPLICACVRSLWRAAVLMVLLMILAETILYTAQLSRGGGSYYFLSFFWFLPFFGAGIVAYQALVALQDHARAPLIGGACLTAALALIVAYRADLFGDYRDHPVALAAGLAVVGLVLCPFRVLVNRTTIFLGRISYSMYLVHAPLIHRSGGLYRAIYSLPGSDTLHYAVAALATFVMVVPVAWLLFRYVETPGLALGRVVLRQLGARRRARLAEPVPAPVPTPA